MDYKRQMASIALAIASGILLLVANGWSAASPERSSRQPLTADKRSSPRLAVFAMARKPEAAREGQIS